MSGLDNLKDRAIFCGWVCGLVLLGALVWFLTQPVRASYMLRTVNKVLAADGDGRHLAAPVKKPASAAVPPGCWYSLENSDSQLLVFAIMRDGILLPCGAVVSPNGAVEEIIPLGTHARQVFDQIPQGLVQLYTRKIESAQTGGTAGGHNKRSGR